MADPAGLSGSDTHTGAHARPAPRPDPLDELRDDLGVVLKVLEATRAPGMGRKRSNRFAHALEAARREVRRALEAAGAGSGS